MDKIDRTKEIWHIPKRGSIHQTIFMVSILASEEFLNKSWSSSKQEAMASKMSIAGLTKSGKALTHQSVRTLLANLPKYLGFVFIDDSSIPSKIVVSEIGYELIKNHPLKTIPKYKNLKELKKAKVMIEKSDVVLLQMAKLIITNPIIINDCKNILVFPFQLTLKLLLKLNYLDIEELAYIVFHSKSENDYPVLVQRIKNFRKLSNIQRSAEINAYKKTLEGNLTLVKAPTAGYYMYLCHSTGMCERITVTVNKKKEKKLSALRIKDKKNTKEYLKQFRDAEIYDFKDNWFLWKEYFSNPKRLFPPFEASIKINITNEILTIVEKDKNITADGIIDNMIFSFPVFTNELYKITFFDLNTGNKIYSTEREFTPQKKRVLINLKTSYKTTAPSLVKTLERIEEFFSGKYEGFDKEYQLRLKTLQKIIGKDYFQNVFKGGRLENLFFDLLNLAKNKKIIDELFWYGKINKYGIATPAPGGKNGNPDIVFEIDKYQFVLELTTIKGNRSQWNSAEASSVPDHITKFKKLNPNKTTIGIFSAPSIHEQLKKNLGHNAREENVGMIFVNCIDLSKLFTKSKNHILEELISLAKIQMQF